MSKTTHTIFISSEDAATLKDYYYHCCCCYFTYFGRFSKLWIPLGDW